MSENKKLPSIADIYTETYLTEGIKDNELALLCNCEPPSTWIEKHPYANVSYLPISKIEFLLTKIFNKWWVEIRDSKLIANSVSVTVRLYYRNPITGDTEFQDGIGAQPLQTDQGRGTTDFDAIKSNAVAMALPSAESYAIKDAAEKLGKLFGKDLNRKDTMNYEQMLINNIDRLQERASKVLEE